MAMVMRGYFECHKQLTSKECSGLQEASTGNGKSGPESN